MSPRQRSPSLAMENNRGSDPPQLFLKPHAASSVIKDGTVAGVLPEAEAFAVHYPGYPSSPSRAIQTLGGLSEISKARSSESDYMELRFRPEDPYSHPAFGEPRPSSSLLLKLSKTKISGAYGVSASVVARVRRAYHFEGMVDYQHVVAVHAAEARSRNRPLDSEEISGFESNGILNSEAGDVMMLVPTLFSVKDMPEKIVLNPSANLFAKNMQRGVVEHRWEMDMEPCLAINFNIENVPVKINWEDHIPKGTTEWEWQTAVCKLFDERPIWPRWTLHECLLDYGLQISENQLKRLLFRAGYYFSTGPFDKFWIKKGYDPRKDSESRIYQRIDFRLPFQLRGLGNASTSSRSKPSWKDLCRFQAFPSKNFICLQLFELDDDFIQEEIRKPCLQTTCSDAEGLLKSASELIERAKKEESLKRFWKPKKECNHANRDSNYSEDVHCTDEPGGFGFENEDQGGPGNIEEEDEEEEEEEEELDGYDPLAVGGEFPMFQSDQIRGGISDNYVQELLGGLPFDKGTKDQQPTGVHGADISDDEYQIYEQDSDDNDNYFN